MSDTIEVQVVGVERVELGGKPERVEVMVPGTPGPQGPAGPAGAQGPQGAAGTPGAPGTAGAQGVAGTKGDTGASGAPGVAGTPGAAGATGAKGDKGDPGVAGATGAKGDTGNTGAQGTQGLKGDQGIQGLKGDQGLPGVKGDQGNPGSQGIQGVKGDTGNQGSAGADGPAGATGATGPAGVQGPPAPVLSTVPPVGWQIAASVNFSHAASALTSGRVTLVPVDVGTACSVDAIISNITTAAVAGTYTATVGLYPSDANGWPDGSVGPLVSAAIGALTPVGIKQTTFTPIVLAPGRYWLAFLYVQTVAPTTLPQMSALTNAGIALPRPAATNPASSVRGYYVSGQTSLGAIAFTAASVTASANSDIMALGLRRSA